ncbi:MAG: sulfite exporter TauE/SafE family protein [Armatimonadetes bacterium]|nr:sulfite exporter TauE/SafE family protein [Armatimonadota bacterium]
MQVVLLILGGLVAGACGGLFGIGGGVVIVPFLVLALGYSQHKAQGTSLVALLAPVGILGLIEYYKRGEADLKSGAFVALGFVVGAWGGSKTAVQLPEEAMRRTFAGFLVLLGLYLFFQK